MGTRQVLGALLAACLPATAAFAQASEAWSLHGQITYVGQRKPAFDADYSGPHSLEVQAEHSYSLTTTLFAGARLWQGAEGYANIEGVQGVPFSNMSGLGGFTNGELQKTATTTLSFYRARLFLRQTFGFGGGTDVVEADANQLAGPVDRRRLVVTAGNLAVSDLYDTNAFAHDPRSDFLNWALMGSGAYDYAADARGYTWGLDVAWQDAGWSLRVGRFLEPRESNGLALDPHIEQHHGDQVELDRALQVGGMPGTVRLLAFHNVADMGRYRDALELARLTGTAPDLALVRGRNSKSGLAFNAEQDLAPDLGVFARASWNDGASETYAFTEIDRSLALGASLRGRTWGRPADRAGLAVVGNGISGPHRDYLAAGGLGFFLGDGRLDYRPEHIFEANYVAALGARFAIGADLQRIYNPGYNSDRGPVWFFGLRLHASI